MKTAVFTVLVCLASSSAWAIDCQKSPGPPSTGWWAWREIEGRKCWFIKAGPMPPKSELHWPAKQQQEGGGIELTAPPEAPDQPSVSASQGGQKSPIRSGILGRFTTSRAKPVSGPPPGLRNGHLDLMNSAPLSSIQVLDDGRGKPATADSFDARFKGADVHQP
jgi:hypothetical protein